MKVSIQNTLGSTLSFDTATMDPPAMACVLRAHLSDDELKVLRSLTAEPGSRPCSPEGSASGLKKPEVGTLARWDSLPAPPSLVATITRDGP